MPFRAYLPVADDLNDGGEITEYMSRDDGRTWVLSRNVTEDSEYSHNYVERVRNPHPEFEVLWSYGNSCPTGEHHHDEASEVMMYGIDRTIGTHEYGTAHAYVEMPSLHEPTPIYMYYGNHEASDAGNFCQTMQVSYTHLPTEISTETCFLSG